MLVLEISGWFIFSCILASFIEHQVHRNLMHRRNFLSAHTAAFKRVFEAHTLVHHKHYTAIFSDELKSYDGLDTDYQHAVINHAVEYVNGRVHTNTMENFWSLLKRGLHGTYISVEPFHLFRNIDEQAFRYNNRKDMDDAERFSLAVSYIIGTAPDLLAAD